MTVVIAKSYPDAATLKLVADIQFREPYASGAMNRKLRGILFPGIYSGFYPVPGAGLNLKITSLSATDQTGTASLDFGMYQISVRHQSDLTVALTAGTNKIVALQAMYGIGVETYQVNSDSTIQAAEIVLLDINATLATNQLEICKVRIPAGATQLTAAMIDLSGRKVRRVGIEFSSEIDKTDEDVAATSLAVKRAIASIVDSAPTALNTLKKIAAAINNDPAFYTTLTDLLALKAPLASPALTGTPTAPTAAQTVNNTQIATTAFVKAALAALVDSAPGTLDTLNELATALGNDPNFATTMSNLLGLKAPLASPALTGTPTGPTAAAGTNTTQLSTTAFVQAAISALNTTINTALGLKAPLASPGLTGTPTAPTAAASTNNTQIATTAFVQNGLKNKQDADSTLNDLSGKTVAGLLSYLGLGEGSALPVGIPVPWPLATPPNGWITMAGQTISAAQYPILYSRFGATLPDLRGYFIRGWDNSRGVDAGRSILAGQLPRAGQFFVQGTVYGISDPGNGPIIITDAIGLGGTSSNITVNNDTGYSGGYVEVSPLDTRPYNVAFNYIVRAA